MQIIENYLASVVFLCSQERGDDGVMRPIPRATGFFVSIQEEGGTGVLPYVVTARHCIEEASDPLIIRVNYADASRGYADIETARDDWVSHDSADVALIPFVAPKGGTPLRISMVPLADFVGGDYRFWNRGGPFEETLAKIGGCLVELGDEVAFVGLFVQHAGRLRNLPIARFGNISRMPWEEIAVRRTGDRREQILGYLAECRSWGGHSGSPVWWTSPNARHLRPVPHPQKSDEMLYVDMPLSFLALLGLVSAHYDIPKKAEQYSDIVTEINAGIAVVTPAAAIYDLLMRDDVVEDRDARMGRDKLEMPPATYDATKTVVVRQLGSDGQFHAVGGEPGGEAREDRQIGVELDPSDSANAEGE